MKNLSFIYIASCLVLTACYSNRTFEEAVRNVNRKISNNDTFEKNRLRESEKLRVIPENTKVVVGSFLKDNDYARYFSDNQDSCAIGTNLWVFLPDELLPLIEDDLPGISGENRRYKLLGVNEVIVRDTMVLIEVNSNDLFRPAYNHRVDTIIPTDPTDPLKYVREDAYVSAWFENESRYSNYPWTRKGYTYMWGNRRSKDYIGVSEFVIKKGSEGRVIGYEALGGIRVEKME